MSCLLQSTFNLQLPTTRPLIPVECVMVMLDRDEDSVLSMIESGRLSWAWDIAGADADRREIRIWRDCLDAELRGNRQPDAEAESAVLSSVIPCDPITVTHLRQLFTASQGHVQNLVEAGLLQGLSQAQRGPGGSPRVTRASVANFLRQRRIV